MKYILCCAALLLAFLCADADAVSMRSGGSRMPAAARTVGYTLNTFSTESTFNTSTVDTTLSYASGFKWYFWNFFFASPTTSFATLNGNGSVTLHYLQPQGQIVSAAEIHSAPWFVGTAFGGGGYFESEFSFNPNADFTGGWPAWWMMTLEHLFDTSGEGGVAEQWQGQAPGYTHFLEVDTFEFDRFGFLNRYGATLHDWYGQFNNPCGNHCSVDSDYNLSTAHIPNGTDWTIPHRVGALWVPATNSTQGYYSFWFDDELAAGPFFYSQFTTEGPPPTISTPWTFGIGDQQHLVLILGAGATPFTVTKVNVWQASTSGNITN